MKGALLTGAVAAALHEPPTFTYSSYVEKFGKDRDVTREATFNTNMKLIALQNADPARSWVAGPNEFTDWTNEEFRARRTSRPHRGPTNPLVDAVLTVGDLPARVDWREKKGVVTPAKNQGQCGSCWAFSATETLESHYAIATNEDAPLLAPQQIVSCAPNPRHCGGSGGCDGSTQPLAFNYTMTAGLSAEASYPYQGETGTCDPSKIKPVVVNSGFVNLPANSYSALMNAVATKGPIAISVDASGLCWQFYFGGIIGPNDIFKCGFAEDHAVQLVGYGVDGSKMYWLVRNSWGESWGESGYIRIQRLGEGKEPCGVDDKPADGDACEGNTTKPTLCGYCAILSSSSYPTGVRKDVALVV